MKLTRMKSDRPRREHDLYPTPYGLAMAAVSELIGDWCYIPELVLDAGAGEGIWGKAFTDFLPSTIVDGVDIRKISPKPACYSSYYEKDFLRFVPEKEYEVIIGNPPYSLMEEFVRKGLEIVGDGGCVFFLCRLEFLASQKRFFGLFKDHPLHSVYVSSRRPSFFSTNGRKTTDAQDYAMYLWKKGWDGDTKLKWLYWEYSEDE